MLKTQEVNPSFQNSSHDPSFWMIFARGITPRVFEFETRSEKQTCCSDIPTSRQVPCDSYWIGQLNREKLEERLRAQPLAVCWWQLSQFHATHGLYMMDRWNIGLPDISWFAWPCFSILCLCWRCDMIIYCWFASTKVQFSCRLVQTTGYMGFHRVSLVRWRLLNLLQMSIFSELIIRRFQLSQKERNSRPTWKKETFPWILALLGCSPWILILVGDSRTCSKLESFSSHHHFFSFMVHNWLLQLLLQYR